MRLLLARRFLSTGTLQLDGPQQSTMAEPFLRLTTILQHILLMSLSAVQFPLPVTFTIEFPMVCINRF